MLRNFPLLIFCLVLVACTGTPYFITTPTPQVATIFVTLDMGSGGAGFAATIYIQEVSSGKTFFAAYSAGSHGLVVLPTSAPVAVQVDVPGTYVVYARLVNEPESYHYGATGCGPAQDCEETSLLAIQVSPGEVYSVTISDRSAVLPERDQPVTVPWRLKTDAY